MLLPSKVDIVQPNEICTYLEILDRADPDLSPDFAPDFRDPPGAKNRAARKGGVLGKREAEIPC
jgi:hypothetical protein